MTDVFDAIETRELKSGKNTLSGANVGSSANDLVGFWGATAAIQPTTLGTDKVASKSVNVSGAMMRNLINELSGAGLISGTDWLLSP